MTADRTNVKRPSGIDVMKALGILLSVVQIALRLVGPRVLFKL